MELKTSIWKSILVAGLLVLNIAFYFMLKERKDDLEQSYSELRNPDVYYHLTELSSYIDRRVEWEDSLSAASERLASEIEKIHEQYCGKKISSPGEYFSIVNEVPLPARQNLFNAFQDYTEACSNYLTQQVIPASEWRNREATRMSDELQKLISRASKIPENTSINTSLDGYITLMSSPFTFSMQGRKEKGTIKWQTGPNYLDYGDYINLINRHRDAAQSGKIRQAQRAIEKLSSVFISDSRVQVFGKICSLDKASAADLESMCKFLLMTQWKTSQACRKAFHEANGMILE